MRGRDFSKRIDIYEVAEVSNGYGGYTVSESLVTTTWAKIESVSQNERNLAEFGIDDPQNTVRITVRKRNDLDLSSEIHLIKYRSSDYILISAPTNTNFTDRFITFLAKRRSPSETQAVVAETQPTITVTDP